MAKPKNLKRRRQILQGAFRLFREKGMDHTSLQQIAEEAGISKSLLQSYYPHRIKLVNDICSRLFTVVDQQVRLYDNFTNTTLYARANAFIYTIIVMGVYDKSLDRVISEIFEEIETLTNWAKMMNEWVDSRELFSNDREKSLVAQGIIYVSAGVGRLYGYREQFNLSAIDLSDYVTTSIMYSFLNRPKPEIDQALEDGHKIIRSCNIDKVHHAVLTMFDDEDALN